MSPWQPELCRVQFQLVVLVQKDLWKDLMGCLLTPGFRLELLPASPSVAPASRVGLGGRFLITTSCPGGSGRRRLFLALLDQLCVMSVCRQGPQPCEGFAFIQQIEVK